jgi:hypothetical protein
VPYPRQDCGYVVDEADAVERRATEGEQIAMSVWLT